MKLQKIVDALDAQLAKGDIIGAFEVYAADHCVTLSNESDKTYSKAQKAEALRSFLSHVARINRIERFAVQLVSENVSDSQFVFDFTDHYGRPMVYNEVIRRTWENGKMVEEQYLMNQTLEVVKATTTKKASATAKKSAEPAGDKKPATKSAKDQPEIIAQKKSDDLTLIEGIGPKIAELLKAEGIATFAQLAACKPAAITAILGAAGSRYQMHDATTWPKQAALARDGKTAELAKWQGELKAGK